MDITVGNLGKIEKDTLTLFRARFLLHVIIIGALFMGRYLRFRLD